MAELRQTSAACVLLADASPVTRAEAARVFAAQAIPVVRCANADDVIPFAREHRPAVVFLDAAMPGLDAEACVRELERDADTRSAVVVLTCPRDIDEARLAALEASGALLVLVKPLTRDGVLKAFRQAVAESPARKSTDDPGRRNAA